MLPHQIPSGLRHLFHVERGIGKSGVAAVYRRGEGGIVDPVFIGLDGSATAGMKVRRHLKGFLDLQILRKADVQGMGKTICRDLAFRIEHRQVASGMNAGIGPAGSRDSDLLSGHLRKCLVQDAFHRTDAALLGLKAGKIPAVIGHNQHYSLHSISSPSA